MKDNIEREAWAPYLTKFSRRNTLIFKHRARMAAHA
jgi:hypothetical protein